MGALGGLNTKPHTRRFKYQPVGRDHFLACILEINKGPGAQNVNALVAFGVHVEKNKNKRNRMKKHL